MQPKWTVKKSLISEVQSYASSITNYLHNSLTELFPLISKSHKQPTMTGMKNKKN